MAALAQPGMGVLRTPVLAAQVHDHPVALPLADLLEAQPRHLVAATRGRFMTASSGFGRLRWNKYDHGDDWQRCGSGIDRLA
jgi:hypothetical protein